MPYDIKTSSAGRLMIVRHTGDVACDEISAVARSIDDLIDAMSPPYLLIDIRAADSLPDAGEIVESRKQRRTQSPLVKKIAYVTSRMHTSTIEALTLGHIQRGIGVRVFCGEMEALEWLLHEANRSAVANRPSTPFSDGSALA